MSTEPDNSSLRQMLLWVPILALLAGLFVLFQMGLQHDPIWLAVMLAGIVAVLFAGSIMGRRRVARDPAFAQEIADSEVRVRARYRKRAKSTLIWVSSALLLLVLLHALNLV